MSTTTASFRTGSSAGVEEVFDSVRGRDPATLDRSECAAHLGQLKRLRAWLDANEMQILRRQRELSAAGKGESPEAAAARSSGHSSRSSRTVGEREATCAALPGLEGALDEGAITAEHIDAIAAVARRLDDECRAEFHSHESELLTHARAEHVDIFRRRCQRLARRIQAARSTSDADELTRQRARVAVRRWVDQATGMHHTHLELDPIRDATFWSAVDAQLARLRSQDQSSSGRRSFAQLQADAVVSAASATAGSAGRRIPEIGVLIQWADLADEATAGSACRRRGQSESTAATGQPICETTDGVQLPVSTVRRLACDANVYPVVLGGDGVVLDVGRTERTATAGQRRALAAMHATCAHPHCTVGFDSTRAHHVRFWTRDRGPTSIENLLPLCETHHHLVHEGGWRLTMTPDRVGSWWMPNGELFHRGSTIDRPTVEPEHEVAASA